MQKLQLPQNAYLEDISIVLVFGKEIKTSGYLYADEEAIHLAVGNEEKDKKGNIISKIATVIEIPLHYLSTISYQHNGERTMIKLKDFLNNAN